ncbi:VOC family protein [Costertonia aggregata]|uniref:VOC family protein n=1 Tax=Costertonia aggregata TaxID=343403 RepID=A0A7H9AKM5_9FLAO|nr:VOC family protein [Costertonia aggregata]QLG44000.1 VOC family protein [Costertonia aggregata]
MGKVINGIQQIGIGVAHAKEVFNWYRKHLGFDILVFEDESKADLMTRYTAGNIEDRYAILAMNMVGGGGLEIWQFKSRTPQASKNEFQLGDLGINVMKLRTKNLGKTHERFKRISLGNLTEVYFDSYFFFTDPWGNWVQIVQDDYCFFSSKSSSGGVLGAIIGVSDIGDSLSFYQKVLGYTVIVSDTTDTFTEFSKISGGHRPFRKVVLTHENRKFGGFGELYGPSQIELVQVLERSPNTIYENRLWGDLGYIHLCFDISGLNALKDETDKLGYHFKVDSADSFDMGDAAGRFAYMEDPDGTLIELVETHKVPIFKRLGIHINLKKRNPFKPLPKWVVGALRMHRRTVDI